eukprot:TRINITY_DN10055_c0_g1_i1.p1 TRINITY_DN10055_c0_g1~~TRINITY_DN10055_c0_g1_i1.p1  ORF type:complete len:593 (+),score=17.87 TRINITY_DN10055_c0_g1_i1:129-1781(+)
MVLFAFTVRVFGKPVVKKFDFGPKTTVGEARVIISNLTGAEFELYGLFLPPRPATPFGEWLRDDATLDSYKLGNAKNTDEKELAEYRKKERPIKLYFVPDKLNSILRTIMVDDTKTVGEYVPSFGRVIGFEKISLPEELDAAFGRQGYMILDPSKTLRAQGFVGALLLGLVLNPAAAARKVAGQQGYGAADCFVYVRIPHLRGMLLKKKGLIAQWKPSFYTLDRDSWCVYKDEASASDKFCKPETRIDMRKVTDIRQYIGDNVPSEFRLRAFEVGTAEKTILLLSPEIGGREKWMDNLLLSQRMYSEELSSIDTMAAGRKQLATVPSGHRKQESRELKLIPSDLAQQRKPTKASGSFYGDTPRLPSENGARPASTAASPGMPPRRRSLSQTDLHASEAKPMTSATPSKVNYRLHDVVSASCVPADRRSLQLEPTVVKKSVDAGPSPVPMSPVLRDSLRKSQSTSGKPREPPKQSSSPRLKPRDEDFKTDRERLRIHKQLQLLEELENEIAAAEELLRRQMDQYAAEMEMQAPLPPVASLVISDGASANYR